MSMGYTDIDAVNDPTWAGGIQNGCACFHWSDHRVCLMWHRLPQVCIIPLCVVVVLVSIGVSLIKQALYTYVHASGHSN